MNFDGIKSFNIPEGNVSAIHVNGKNLWREPYTNLLDTEWHVGNVSIDTGEIDDTDFGSRYIDPIDISRYVGRILRLKCDGCVAYYSIMALYDENHVFIYATRVDIPIIVPKNAKYVRLSIDSGVDKTAILQGDFVNLWDVLEVREGRYDDPKDTDRGHVVFSVEDGLDLACYYGGYVRQATSDMGGSGIDRHGNLFNDPTGASGHTYTPTDTEAFPYITVAAKDTNVEKGDAICNWLRELGSSVVGGSSSGESDLVTYLEPAEYTFSAFLDTSLPIDGVFDTAYTWYISCDGVMYEFTENNGSYMSTANMEFELDGNCLYGDYDIVNSTSGRKHTIGLYYKV